jgi:hypothetical protein
VLGEHRTTVDVAIAEKLVAHRVTTSYVDEADLVPVQPERHDVC